MSKLRLLIAIPIKTAPPYRERAKACEATWLKDCPVDYKFFSDADLGLDENDVKIRPMRTKLMCKYAYDNGYDFIFRTDSDAYVWVNRLLACGFENHDYMGFCLEYPKHLELDHGLRTAHGGIGLFLSGKAMKIIADAEPHIQNDGIFWGDIWAGEVLWKHQIYCHRDTRFLDGFGRGNLFANDLPADHPYISIHPVPAENMYAFQPMPTECTPPAKQLFEPEADFRYGVRRPDICKCDYCCKAPLLAVDFDGTIYDGENIFAGCIDALSEFRKEYRVGIFSARQGKCREWMIEYLNSHCIPYDLVLEPKPDAVAFIDDKGLRFSGKWNKVKL
jgi:hypothetical protein